MSALNVSLAMTSFLGAEHEFHVQEKPSINLMFVLGLFVCVVLAHLGTAATPLHAAPLATAILTGIQEEPAAVAQTWALLDSFHLL